MKMQNGDKLDEKLSEVLSRAVLSETESSFADRDAFQNWLEEGAQRQTLVRRRKIRRIGLAAAAVFVCALLLSGSFMVLTDTLPPSLQALLGPGEGVASPDVNSDVESGNGNVVIGGDGNGNTGTWSATFTSYDDIPEKYREQIVWFEEIPEGYELDSIEITKNLYSIEYISNFYADGHLTLLVKQTMYLSKEYKTTILNGYDGEVQIGKYMTYTKKMRNAMMYFYHDKESEISIFDFSDLTQKKIEAMIASVRTGWNRK